MAYGLVLPTPNTQKTVGSPHAATVLHHQRAVEEAREGAGRQDLQQEETQGLEAKWKLVTPLGIDFAHFSTCN